MRTILLVDDEYAIVEVLGALLAEEGFHVVTAATGEEALGKLAKERPDLIVLDVMMPRMDGREVLRALRRDPATARLPVILMSAAAEALRVGERDDRIAFLRKPFTLEVLLETLGRLLGDERGEKS